MDYRALLFTRPAVREPETRPVPPELEVQARWFAGEFGRLLRAPDGAPVEIVQFGTWNRGAGPDFLDAAVRFAADPDPVRGAIEIDLDPADWERHGHGENPAFEGVVLHLYVHAPPPGARESFTRTRNHRLVPRAQLDLARLVAGPPPEPPRAHPGRCCAPLREIGAEAALRVVLSAARHRLGKKSARWSRLAAAHGEEEALWQLLASALGFHANQLTFSLLAQRLPLHLVRAQPAAAAAWLLGLAGFLDAPARELGADDEARAWRAAAWAQWWPRRGEWERLILPRDAWRLSGVRPANHPQRRLAALSAIAGAWPSVRAVLDAPDPATVAFAALGALSDPFWDRRCTLASHPLTAPLALVGDARASEMLANVFFPAILSRRPTAWEQFLRLPEERSNRRADTAAARLLGPPAARQTLPRTAAVQQGLLQIYEDFCQRDASDCARCPFPERVGATGKGPSA